MADVYAQDFESALKQLGTHADDYYAVLTRGHAWDCECVAQILKGEFTYLGMIGSRAKVATVYKRLGDMGFTQADLDKIYAPIGLSLGGQTPAEIAVSIAAQLVQVRAARGGAGVTAALSGHGMLVKITQKRGSAPRGVGAAMLVGTDGSIKGTIGGGVLEFRANELARELMARGETYHQKSFELGDAADLGMVCGGSVILEFTAQ